jgi:hypothetical protein
MADFKLTGGCFCGGVRYTITAPAVDTHHCHCSICRKFHGAIFVTLSVFPRSAFTYDKGTGNLGTYNSSEKVHRHFCKTCGCPISLDLVENPGVIAVATGTIDNGQWPGSPKNELRHAFAPSKVGWYEIADKLPQNQGL